MQIKAPTVTSRGFYLGLRTLGWVLWPPGRLCADGEVLEHCFGEYSLLGSGL